ncbi:MAG: outer membrane beta-barrel protein [Rhizobiaceae bacterium]
MPDLARLFFHPYIFICLVTGSGTACADDLADKTNYIRLGAGLTELESTTFFDRDCEATAPPALFGCGNGPDGRLKGAYGDFDSSLLIEAAAGRQVHDWLRAEISLSYRPDWEFLGQSNFDRIPLGTAPVDATGWNASLMANAHLELSALLPNLQNYPVNPFLSAGVGAAYNHIGTVTYRFNEHDNNDRRYTPSGDRVDMAWSLGAGVGVDISDHIELQISYRYVDLGKVETESGTFLMTRDGREDIPIQIDKTEADLTANEALINVIYRY